MSIGKILRIVLILVILGVITWLVVGKVSRTEKAAEKNTPAKSSGAFLADGFVVATSSIDNAVDAAGTLASNEMIELKSEITGRVTGIFFKEGAQVKKGDLLVKLYDEDIRAQIKKLEYQKSLAEKTLERQKELLKISGISQQEVDISANQVDIYNADVLYQKALLQRTELRAPFSGVIGIRNISQGAIIAPTTVIATLLQNNPLKIDFTIAEKYRPVINTRDYIEFTVAGDTNRYRGNIYVIDPQIDLTTRTVKIRALAPNPSGKLSPGTFASIKLVLRQTTDAIMIPSQAVIPGSRDKKVIVSENGQTKFVTVETGLRTEQEVQITSGLQPGDTILISGMMQAKPGMPVKFTNLKKPA